MASSSRARVTAAALLLAFASSACWTGRIYEAGRVREAVVAYHSIALDGESLRVDYSVDLTGSRGGSRPGGARSVAIPLAALEAEPELPVDAFPVEPLPAARGEPGGSIQLMLREAESPAPAAPARPLALVAVRDGRHEGFRLCAGSGAPCRGRFHSATLYRDHTAWWVYPLLPFGVALDAALVPLQLVSVSPFFLFGD